ncbi:DUF5667 domain-containing protein [Nocardioides sp.]|uniref:DUF5667 domain-containing protein n=1 Tax=Nocardioides sp. TaxID=35761 RepID=UPI003783CA85
MTWGFPAQRRADDFDALVEAGTADSPTTRDADLLELVGALRATPKVTARPEFVADLRAALLAEAETALAPADTSKLRLPERRPVRERRFAAVLVGGITAVGVTTGVAVASQGALPGEALYPVKRAIESAHAGLSVGEGSKGSTILASASDRLDEVDALSQQDDFGDEIRIAQTLDTFTAQATEASDLLLADYAHHGDASSIAELRDFASSSLDQLAALEPLVPASARDELIRAARTLETIDSEAAQRCPQCGGTPIESIPPVLAAAQEQIFVPSAPQPSPQPARGGKHQHRGGGGPHLPHVQPGDVGPASVTDAGDGTPTPGASGTTDPVQALTQGLTDALTGGGSGTHTGNNPTQTPSVPSVGDVVGGVGEILGSVVGPLTGQDQ